MLNLLLRRLALGVITLWVVSVIIFAGTEILPGDVATAILGQTATPENTAAIRAELGLNRPPQERYVEWLGDFLQGDLGMSLTSRRPITDQIGFRLENTLLGERLRRQQHLFQRAIAMVGGEDLLQCEHRRQQRADPDDPRRDQTQGLRFRSDTEREQADDDREEDQGREDVRATPHRDREVAPDDPQQGFKHVPDPA